MFKHTRIKFLREAPGTCVGQYSSCGCSSCNRTMPFDWNLHVHHRRFCQGFPALTHQDKPINPRQHCFAL